MPYNLFTMLFFSSVKVMIRSARWLGLGALLAALPLSLAASSVTVDFSIGLSDSTTGTGYVTYDTSSEASDGFGPYAYSGHGLDAFDLTYGGHTYTMGEALDAPYLPVVYTPPNTTIPGGLMDGLLALWVVSGTGTCSGSPGSLTCSGSDAGGGVSIIGVGRGTQAFLASDVTGVFISGGGSLLTYNLGYPYPLAPYPGVSEITGSITGESVVATPEPTLLSLLAFGFGGLWFARRRRAIL